MSSPASGLSTTLTAVQDAITDFVTGIAQVFDGIAQFFVQNATTIGYLLATVGVAMFVLNKTGVWSAIKDLFKSVF
jgi:hypothetical protein